MNMVVNAIAAESRRFFFWNLTTSIITEPFTEKRLEAVLPLFIFS